MFFPYRDENPRQSLPYLTIGLITLNVVLYVGLNLGADYRWVVQHYGLVPAHPSPLTGLTWQFLHGGLLHLLGNMWFLWLFGDNVEDALGWWFVPFYLTCGLMAGFLHIALVSWPSMGIPAIGASGAISGVLGAYLMLYPQARIACVCGLVFIYFRTSLRAVWFIGIWFCFQLLGALLTHFGLTGGIAYWAHIGGFLFGAAVVWPIRDQIRPAPATLQSGPEGLLPAREVGELAGYLAAGKGSGAVEGNVELIRRFPEAELPFERELEIAEILEDAGQSHLALISYRRLLGRAGNRDRTVEAYRRLAGLCRRMGRPGQALKHLMSAQRLGAAVGDDIAGVHEELRQTDIGMPGKSRERYLLIQQTEENLPVSQVARIIARWTGDPVTDTAIRLRAFPGILAEGLDLASAQGIAEGLQRQGIWVLIVPEQLRVQPPPSTLLKRMNITAGGLSCYSWKGENFFLQWHHVDLLTCGGIRWRRQEIQDSLHTGTDDPHCEIETVSSLLPPPSTLHYDVVTEKGVNWLLDLYGLEPLRHLRVDPRRFDFHSLGEDMANTREENFTRFVERLTRAAPDVPVTPGLVSFLTGEAQDRHTFQDLGHFERYAAWYLTRLRATKSLHLTAPSAVPAPV